MVLNEMGWEPPEPVDVSQINFEDPQIQQALQGVHPDAIRNASGGHWTFIYGGYTGRRLYIIKGKSHGGLVIDHPEFDQTFWGELGNKPPIEPGKTWDTIAEFAVMGRCAEGHHIYKLGGNINVVAFWKSGGDDARKLEAEALQALLKKTPTLDGSEPPAVDENWIVISQSDRRGKGNEIASTVGQFLGSDESQAKLSDGSKRYDINGKSYSWNELMDLRRQCHSGALPDRQAAAAILCNMPVEAHPELTKLIPHHICSKGKIPDKPGPLTWNQAMQKHGLSVPGQKYWALHSDATDMRFKDWLSSDGLLY